MRALRCLALGLVAILVSVPGVAGNIGFLDAQRAVGAVQEGKVRIKGLEEWAKPRQASIGRLQAKLQELSDRYNAQRQVLAGDALGQLERELVQAQRELEDEMRSFDREINARREQALGEVAAKIGTLAGEYAEANGFDVIFVLGAQPIAYYAKGLDVTDAVIALYDERHPVSRPAQ